MDSSTQETNGSLLGASAGVLLTAAGLAGGIAYWRQRQARERYRHSWQGRLDSVASAIGIGKVDVGQIGKRVDVGKLTKDVGNLTKAGSKGVYRLGKAGVKVGDVGHAGQATMRGVRAGLGGVWDVALGGADAVRTRARVMPAVVESVGEAQTAVGRSLGRLGRSTVGMITGVIWAAVWLGLTGLMAMFIYLPERDRRERFFAQAKRYVAQTRGVVGL